MSLIGVKNTDQIDHLHNGYSTLFYSKNHLSVINTVEHAFSSGILFSYTCTLL